MHIRHRFIRQKRCPFVVSGWAALAVLGMAAAFPQGACAQTAYVDAFTPPNGGGGSSDAFGTLDLQTGLFTAINPLLPSSLYALGFGADGVLYGLGPDSGTGTDLFTVSVGTGTETLLKDFSGVAIYGGSTDSNGLFYGLTLPDTHSHSTLFTVDPVAQTLTVQAKTFAAADGMVVPDNAGGLFVSDTNVTTSGNDGLDAVNSSTGATAYLGDTGLRNLYTGLFSGDSLYTFAYDLSVAGVPEGVYTLDTKTGAASLVALTSNNLDIYAAALVPAPEPPAYAALTLGVLGLAGLGLSARRRKPVA